MGAVALPAVGLLFAGLPAAEALAPLVARFFVAAVVRRVGSPARLAPDAPRPFLPLLRVPVDEAT